VARALTPKLGGRAIIFDLVGPAGGLWKAGPGPEAARVRMDALDFAIFASGRFSYEEGLSRAEITGDISLAKNVLKGLLILF
jgi:hypothetical protein